jgi:rhodanese-related sulfurtransferase
VNPAIPTVSVSDIPAELSADRVLLDIRELDEWDAGHAPNARHLPMSEIVERFAELPTDAGMFVICRSGVRSERVTAYLTGNGLDAANVAGGMLAWAAAGRPLVCEPPHAEPGIL